MEQIAPSTNKPSTTMPPLGKKLPVADEPQNLAELFASMLVPTPQPDEVILPVTADGQKVPTAIDETSQETANMPTLTGSQDNVHPLISSESSALTEPVTADMSVPTVVDKPSAFKETALINTQTVTAEFAVAPSSSEQLVADRTNAEVSTLKAPYISDSDQLNGIYDDLKTNKVTNINNEVVNKDLSSDDNEFNDKKAAIKDLKLDLVNQTKTHNKTLITPEHASGKIAFDDDMPTANELQQSPIGPDIVAPPRLTTVNVENQPMLPAQQIRNLAQVITKQATTMSQGDSKVLIFRLEPSGLGPINVNLQVNQQQVSVEFKMTETQTHAMLANAMPKLQEILKATTETTFQIDNPAPDPKVNVNPIMATSNELTDMGQQMMFNHHGQHGHKQAFTADQRKSYQAKQPESVEVTTSNSEGPDATISILV